MRISMNGENLLKNFELGVTAFFYMENLNWEQLSPGVIKQQFV